MGAARPSRRSWITTGFHPQAAGGEPVQLHGAAPFVVAQRPMDEGETPRRHPLPQASGRTRIAYVVADGVFTHAIRVGVLESAVTQQPKQPALKPALGVKVVARQKTEWENDGRCS